MIPIEYFKTPCNLSQKQYEALRAFFVDRQKAEEVAGQFGYKLSAFYSLVRNFRLYLHSNTSEDFFFKVSKKGRRSKAQSSSLLSLVVALRKKNFSVPDIKTLLDAQGHDVSEGSIDRLLKREGFADKIIKSGSFKAGGFL